jgi:hypothetical protein
MTPRLSKTVVEVQQGLFQPFGEHSLGVIDDAGGRRQFRVAGGRKLASANEARPVTRHENLRQVGFAATGWAVEGQRRPRPVGPAVDPGNRLGVAGRDQKILATESRAVVEVEGQLTLPRQEEPSPSLSSSSP